MSKSVWFTITSSRWKRVLIYLWYSRFNVLCVLNDDIDHRPQCAPMSSVLCRCMCLWVRKCVCAPMFSTTCARTLNIYCAREVTNSTELILSIQQLCRDRAPKVNIWRVLAGRCNKNEQLLSHRVQCVWTSPFFLCHFSFIIAWLCASRCALETCSVRKIACLSLIALQRH